jgi:hypothetical protein
LEEDHRVKQDLASTLFKDSFPVIKVGVAQEGFADGVVTVSNSPDKFFGWVVKVQLVFTVLCLGRFLTSELELFNQIFVTNLGESSTFLGIKVDVINQDKSILHSNLSEIVLFERLVSNNEILRTSKLEVKTDLVILKSNQRKSKTDVSVEPELKRDIKKVFGFSITVVFSEFRDITDHLVESSFDVTWSTSKFVPDVEPDTVLFIDSRSTDFNFDSVDKGLIESSLTNKYILVIKSPFLVTVTVDLRPKSGVEFMECSIVSIEKLVCLL